MSVRIEKAGAVWTIVHDRPEARNAMDPKSADELTAAFLAFDAAKDASVAVFWGADMSRARFRDVSHTVEIFGTCEECAGAADRGRPAGSPRAARSL